MTSGDWLPAQAPFDLVRRGYSPEQVTAHLERLEYDLRITTANRDATNQRLNELGAQLAAAQAEADTLRAQLDRSALEPVSMANLSDRMQRMIRLAEEEAGEIRARAETDADRLRGQLEKSLSESAQARAAFDAERERTRKQLAEQVHGLIAEATAEGEETRNQAQDEAARLLQEANAEAERTRAEARQVAEQTTAEAHHQAETERAEAHETAQRELADAHEAAEQELAAAHTESTRRLTEAAAAAHTLTTDTAAERERLDAESLAHRTQVEEDFEIAITARRIEAHRIITEREDASAATAATLVADATAEANRLVTTATAESETLIQQATTYSKALVNRAAAESHQRVTDADAAVLHLHGLRGQLTDQLNSLAGHLDHIRELAGNAPALLTPPDTERGRPVSAQFPADPAERPTSIDLPVPVLGEDTASDPSDAEPVDETDPGQRPSLIKTAESDAAENGTHDEPVAEVAEPTGTTEDSIGIVPVRSAEEIGEPAEVNADQTVTIDRSQLNGNGSARTRNRAGRNR